MNKRNNGIRYCTKCGHKLHKNGLTKGGTIRYRCRSCGSSKTARRDDVRLRNILDGIVNLLTCKWTFGEYGKRKGVSRWTISRHLGECIAKLDMGPPDPTGEIYNCMVIDATWLKDGAVAIVKGNGYIQQWEFGSYETMDLWVKVLSKMPRPSAIACDGNKSMLEAIRYVYGDTIILQRCQFHLWQNIRLGTPKDSDVPVIREFRQLAYTIEKVKTIADIREFERQFYTLLLRHKDWLEEGYEEKLYTWQTVKRYKHHKARTVYMQMVELLSTHQLFSYIEYPDKDIPNTTNQVEGGINARIAELLRCHRGLRQDGQRWLISAYLWTKTEFKKPPFKLKDTTK